MKRRRQARARSHRVIEPLAQLLAGLEEGNVLLLDLHAVAGARVAPETRVAPLHRKGAEAAQLDAVAARQRRGDLVENGGHDTLDVALIEMRVAVGQALDELGLGHDHALVGAWQRNTKPAKPLSQRQEMTWRKVQTNTRQRKRAALRPPVPPPAYAGMLILFLFRPGAAAPGRPEDAAKARPGFRAD